MKQDKNKLVRCADCANATLLRWLNDPVIAECNVRNRERDVANSMRVCQAFAPRSKEHKIKNIKKQ